VFSQHAFAVYPLASLSTGRRADLHAGQALRPRSRSHARRHPAGYAHRLDRQSEQSDRQLPALSGSACLPRSRAKDVVVVLDEAYNEYLPPAERVDTADWIKDFPNLVITRTFSKIYGLAGLARRLRAGFGRGRRPDEPRPPAVQRQQPGDGRGVAALDDHEFVADSYELNRRGMAQIVAGLKRLGLEHIPSHGNFVTFRAGDAAAVNQKLLQAGRHRPADRPVTACPNGCA
jgi:histidinol-phosphate aminotransferase